MAMRPSERYEEQEPLAPSGYAKRMEELGAVLDRIGAVDRELATVSARRAELIEAARRLSIAHAAQTAAEVTTLSARMWDPSVIAHRELISELACVLRVPERTAGRLMESSRALVNDLPATHAALRSGEISYRHAEAMIDHASTLPIDVVGTFESDLLPIARRATVAQFGQAARVERERRHPESMPVRAARTRADRAVTCEPGRDGMAWLTAYLPAEVAIAAFNRLTDVARELATADEPRTVAQLRADVLGDLLIDGVTEPGPEPVVGSVPIVGSVPMWPGSVRAEVPPEEAALLRPDDGTPLTIAEEDVLRGIQLHLRDETGDMVDLETIAARLITPPVDMNTGHGPPSVERSKASRHGIGHGIRARVLVTVPVLTLLGHDDAPGTLDGYGPIDADTARRLAAAAPSFTRLLTHPETGAVLSVGRDSYAVPRDLRTYLHRDETCRFPGCRARAERCDIDHTVDWAHGGGTEHDNLAHLCGSHHRLKHHTGWTVRRAGGGALRWTSATGHHYETHPGGAYTRR